jgi:hypothetical protein
MRSRLFLLLLLCATLAQPPAAAQQAQDVSPDMAWRLRVAAFRSLQTGSTIRVAAREIGLKTGTVLATGDSALTLTGSGRVPYSGIDSVWIRRNHATAGLIIGSSIGAVVALVVARGRHCDGFSQLNSCTATGALETLGIILGGGLVGAAVGSASPNWKPRYP